MRGQAEAKLTDLHGQTYGLKARQLHRLRGLYKRRVPRDRLVSQEFARRICEVSREIGRQVGTLVNRRGEVEFVTVGDAFRIELPDFKRVRGGGGRLRGLRCIHTHLHGESLTRDDLTDLKLLRLDAMVAVRVDDGGLPTVAEYASLRPADGSGDPVETHEPLPPARIDFEFLDWVEALEAELARSQGARELGQKDRAVLVGVRIGRDPRAEERLEEMRELARTAGVAIVDVVTQRRPVPDPRYLIGKGKVRDVVISAWQQGADIVIFDRDLTSAQVRHITDLVEARIVDRTQLILDIFAQHAQTREGRIQVELAQLRYRLPRLVGRGESMSRLAGGIGGRGPGETKLEVDRRRVRDRIQHLERELERVARQRETRRTKRRREGLPVLSIVGYTNAGKSTLLNYLTRGSVAVADRLFATLDPSSRRLRFPREREVIVTDTVGFIHDLPADLVAGFRATLEEIHDATVLLHVADASRPEVELHIEDVRRVLADLGLSGKPECLALNKCDKLPAQGAATLARKLGGIAVSALTGEGITKLLEAVEPLLFAGEARETGRAIARAAARGV